MKRGNVILSLFASIFCLFVFTDNAKCRQTNDLMSLAKARKYMLVLINQDRMSHGLNPVTMESIATNAGQKHAEEMAKYCYLAHWDREGKLPEERYNEAGGSGFDEENVYLGMHYYGNEPKGPMQLEANPTFTRKEIEDIESTYMNETPPDDGHRRNILDPDHTRVGIALAKSKTANAEVITNTQEFVNDAIKVYNLPTIADVGANVTVAGRLIGGYRFRAVTVGRDATPSPMSVDDLRMTRSYGMPPAYATYYPRGYITPEPVIFTNSGVFYVTVNLSDAGKPGLYYISIWLQDNTGRDFIASQRTILVN